MLPLYLLTNSKTKMWVKYPTVRHILAKRIVEEYSTGVRVLAWKGLKHIATVDPAGNIHEMRPPYQRFERHQIVNKPRIKECACAAFFHPEYGEWRNHPQHAQGVHHPYCQFDQTSAVVYDDVFKKATGGQTELVPGERLKTNQLRPDEMDRARERALGLRGEKTGARG